MNLDIYLNYGGNCEQAFRFYEQHLGSKSTMMMTHGQQPNPASAVPWRARTVVLRSCAAGRVARSLSAVR